MNRTKTINIDLNLELWGSTWPKLTQILTTRAQPDPKLGSAHSWVKPKFESFRPNLIQPVFRSSYPNLTQKSDLNPCSGSFQTNLTRRHKRPAYLWNSEQYFYQFCLTNLSLRAKSNKTDANIAHIWADYFIYKPALTLIGMSYESKNNAHL
jgi:hypothetical protein